jgi:hypothetical protein
MDHLPYPDNPVTLPITVPYLSAHIFATHELCKDGSGSFTKIPSFSEFERWSCDSIGDVKLDRVKYSDQDLLAMTQAFVYFGLLNEFLGDEFVLADFVRDCNCWESPTVLKICANELIIL